MATESEIVAPRNSKKAGARKPCHDIQEAQVDIVFVRTLRDQKSKCQGLQPPAFLESLVRLAHQKSSASTGFSLAAATRELLEVQILPNAQQSNVAEFRERLQKTEVQELLEQNRIPLEFLFRKYAAQDASDEADDEQNLKEFTKMLQNKQLLVEGVTKQMANIVFNNAQHTRYGVSSTVAVDQESQMDFEEFLEAIAAMTECRYPNPYVKFPLRLKWVIRSLLDGEKHDKSPRKKEKSKMKAMAALMHVKK